MRSIVEIIQVHDGTWYLQIMCLDTSDVPVVNTLIPCARYIYAEQLAQLLKINVDKVRKYDGEPYKIA